MEMMKEADSNEDGMIDYTGQYCILPLEAQSNFHISTEFVKVHAHLMY
jgi:hypothetical protein